MTKAGKISEPRNPIANETITRIPPKNWKRIIAALAPPHEPDHWRTTINADVYMRVVPGTQTTVVRGRGAKMQTMQQCTGHWNPFAGRRPALGHGVPGRRPARPALGHGRAGRRPALACTGGTSECRDAGRRPALAGPKARHCGARSVRAAQ